MTRSTSAVAFGTVAVAFTMLTTRPARADEIADLEKSLAEEHAALSTSDCSAACRALASIRRAADRICALEQGARCSAAHAKADDATRRVREACPECAIASISPQPQHPAPVAQEERVSVATGANAPPPESSRGGCASCDVGAASPGDGAAGALAILALAQVLRRKKKRGAER